MNMLYLLIALVIFFGISRLVISGNTQVFFGFLESTITWTKSSNTWIFLGLLDDMYIQQNFNSSNTDGSFTTATSISFLSP